MANKSIDQKLADVVKKVNKKIKEATENASLPITGVKDTSTLTGNEPSGSTQLVYSEYDDSTLEKLLDELENGSSETSGGKRVLSNITLVNPKISGAEISDSSVSGGTIKEAEISDSTVKDSTVSGGIVESVEVKSSKIVDENNEIHLDGGSFATAEEIEKAWNEG